MVLFASPYCLRRGRPKDARDTGRVVADRLLTIDHVASQRESPVNAMDPANLRLMTARDNAFRGDRYDRRDKRK